MRSTVAFGLSTSARSAALARVRTLWNLIGERNAALISAGIAFYALLAIFPAVAALVAFWGVLSDPAQIEAQLALLSDLVPEEAFALLSGQVDRLVASHDGALGFTTALSLLVTLWSARLGVGALIQGLNAIHGVPDRNGVVHTALALGLTVALIGVAMVALATVVVLPVVLAFLPLGDLAVAALRLGNWAVVLAVVTGAVALVYRYGTNRRPRTAWLSPGLWLAVGVWAAASLGFSRYMADFGDYGAVYGSLGAVIALLMWFYISAFAVLLGAALNASARPPETTVTGAELPSAPT